MEFPSRLNEISDDCCGKFVADFAEMASAHDTASDVSDIGAEFDDPGTPLTGQRSAWLTWKYAKHAFITSGLYCRFAF